TRRVTRQGENLRAIHDRVTGFDSGDKAALDHRQNAVLEAAVGGLGGGGGLTGTVIDFGLAHEIPRIGERRYPSAGLEPRVPADMIGMQVGAHDNVDVIGRAAAGGKSRDIARGFALVPVWPGGPRLVLTDTGVEQDGSAAESDQVAL